MFGQVSTTVGRRSVISCQDVSDIGSESMTSVGVIVTHAASAVAIR